MSARSKARRRALEVLYAADMRGETPSGALSRLQTEGHEPNNPYTGTLVRGVAEHLGDIDATLVRHSREWTLERMPAVDRNVLRLAVWELLYADDVPDHVALSEAVALVRELSTDESPPFVNGVLGAVQREHAASA